MDSSSDPCYPGWSAEGPAHKCASPGVCLHHQAGARSWYGASEPLPQDQGGEKVTFPLV